MCFGTVRSAHGCTHTLNASAHRDLIDVNDLSSFQLKPKRAASDNLLPEHGCKQPRVSS